MSEKMRFFALLALFVLSVGLLIYVTGQTRV